MIGKRVEYTVHARKRLRERGIRRQQVRWLLAKGDREKARTDAGAQRWLVRGYLGRHEAAVIFVEDAERYRIITVVWIGDRGEETGD